SVGRRREDHWHHEVSCGLGGTVQRSPGAHTTAPDAACVGETTNAGGAHNALRHLPVARLTASNLHSRKPCQPLAERAVRDCSHHAPRDAARLWRAGLSFAWERVFDLHIEEPLAERAGITRSVMSTILDRRFAAALHRAEVHRCGESFEACLLELA